MVKATTSSAATDTGNTQQQTAAHAWEDIGGNTWETAVQEDAEGRIIVSGGDSTADIIRRRRKRLEQNDYSQRNRRVVRDMIRYIYVLIDASRWTRDKDPVLPGGSRIDVVLNLLQEFIQEYYDQNPLSHLGFVILKDGEAEILTQLSSSSKTNKLALQSVAEIAANEGPSGGGEFSLQNGLEVAGRSLGHQPRHGSREILIVSGALASTDPGHLLTETLPRLKAANIRVSTLALAAEMHVCRKVAEETGGSLGVCLDKAHLRDWLLGQCVPPPALKRQHQDFACEMVKMGFPARSKWDIPTLVHATRDIKLLARTAYTCPQCYAKCSELPMDCVVCGLKLVLSPHLARSFHHLFPVAPFEELPPESKTQPTEAVSSGPSTAKSSSPELAEKRVLDSKIRLSNDGENTSCFACLRLVGVPTVSTDPNKSEGDEVLRYVCPDCKNVFCVDCDSFLHETLHNCPGCLLV
jgi:transcription initiation factor TFIIH subunit 2